MFVLFVNRISARAIAFRTHYYTRVLYDLSFRTDNKFNYPIQSYHADYNTGGPAAVWNVRSSRFFWFISPQYLSCNINFFFFFHFSIFPSPSSAATLPFWHDLFYFKSDAPTTATHTAIYTVTGPGCQKTFAGIIPNGRKWVKTVDAISCRARANRPPHTCSIPTAPRPTLARAMRIRRWSEGLARSYRKLTSPFSPKYFLFFFPNLKYNF